MGGEFDCLARILSDVTTAVKRLYGYCLNIFTMASCTWLSSFSGLVLRFCCDMPRHTSFLALALMRSTTNSAWWMVIGVLPQVPASAGPEKLGSKGGMPPVAL